MWKVIGKNIGSGIAYFVLQERVPLDEVFGQLKASRGGLSSADAEARLVLFGPNKLEKSPVISFFSNSD